jgi:hypothetical protein
MARTPQGLADGTLAAGSNTIFTSVNATFMTNFTLTNTDTDIKTVDVYVDRGTSRIFESKRIPAGVGSLVSIASIGGLTLDTGDILTITSDKAGINYDLSGWVIA